MGGGGCCRRTWPTGWIRRANDAVIVLSTREGSVEKGILREYQRLSPEAQLKFDRWLNANVILGSIVAVGMLAMAMAGFSSVGQPDAKIAANLATSQQPTRTAPSN